MARTEEERAGGFLLARYNGHEWELPTLKREGERAWKRLLGEKLGGPVARLLAEWKPGSDVRETLGEANEAYVDAMAELIVAYDESGVIGTDGVDGLDSDQIRDLFGRLYDVANPFEPDLQKALFSTAMVAIQRALEVARLAGQSSTNGAPPTATAPPAKSIDASTTSSSGSSGSGRRNGRRTSVSVG